MALTREQLKAIHAKYGSSGVSSRNHKAGNRQITMKSRPKRAKIVIPKGDIRSMLTAKEVQEWEDTVGSEIVGVETGRFEGKNTVEVKFLNGENWFEFQTMKEQNTFFEKQEFEKDESVGKFIEVEHPKIEGYVNLISGISLFKDRLMEK